MLRPIHFEIPSLDPARAINFYSSVFMWEFIQAEGPQPYWLIKTGDGDGIDGGLIIHPGVGKFGTVLTVEVPDVDDYRVQVQVHGGSILLEKQPFYHVGWIVYCIDTEGNTFGMLQRDPKAE